MGYPFRRLKTQHVVFPSRDRLSRAPLRVFLGFLPSGFTTRQFLRSQSEYSKPQRCEWSPTAGDARAHSTRPAVLSLSTAMGRARLAVSQQGSACWRHCCSSRQTAQGLSTAVVRPSHSLVFPRRCGEVATRSPGTTASGQPSCGGLTPGCLPPPHTRQARPGHSRRR
jgi:hypothetical protein